MTGELISLFNQPAAAEQRRALPLPAAPDGWPAPPGPAAYHGLPGEIVDRIAPNTEADPAAILVQLLVCAGALIGQGAFFQVEATRHHPNEFAVLVGDSAKARKGSSFDHVARLLDQADPAFTTRLSTGLSSGEGLIWSVRDPSGPDPGTVDKRLLVIEPEFATVLKSTGRELSTLSPTLRSAWDGRPLALLTRTAPARASTAHITLIGHITQHELRRHITQAELANGFLNRFIFAAVRRVRLLPEGGDPDPLKDTGLGRYLTSVLKHAQTAGKVTFSTDARELWWQLYPQLTQPADGPLGQLTARAEAHTIRLALLYTLLDGQRKITTEHLTAALALWDYAQRSAAWALGQTTGDPLAEQIHTALTRSTGGLTRTQIRDLCQRNLPTERVEQALHTLAAAGRAHQARTLTRGRPAELWTAAPTIDA